MYFLLLILHRGYIVFMWVWFTEFWCLFKTKSCYVVTSDFIAVINRYARQSHQLRRHVQLLRLIS